MSIVAQAEIVNQRLHAFTETKYESKDRKKTEEKKERNINNKGFMHRIRDEGKSTHLLVGRMITQRSDAKCQRCRLGCSIVGMLINNNNGYRIMH